MTIFDLKSAYLQLHVSNKLLKYQLVQYKSQAYRLSRPGFGLNSVLKIMAIVLKYILGKVEMTERTTSSYMDDTLLDETVVPATNVVRHLKIFGLIVKLMELLHWGLSFKETEHVCWCFGGGNETPEMGANVSRRELFSV